MSTIPRTQPRIRSRFLSPFLALCVAACALIIASASPPNVYAVDVTLAWDENGGEAPDGYRVYHREEGESYDYDYPAWEGNDTTCTIYGLNDTVIHCFVARAFEASGYETGDSNEVTITLDGGVNPPVAEAENPASVGTGGSSGGGGCFIKTAGFFSYVGLQRGR